MKTYINSQMESIIIRSMEKGHKFEGLKVLGLKDDSDVSNVTAYHLLDRGTVEFLLKELSEIQKERRHQFILVDQGYFKPAYECRLCKGRAPEVTGKPCPGAPSDE